MDEIKSKNISIIIPVWNFGASGGERVLAKLANYFHENGCKVAFLSYYKAKMPYFPIKCPILYTNKKGIICNREDIDNDYIVNPLEKHKGLLNGLNRLSSEYDVGIANYSLTAYAVNKSKINNKFYYIQAYEAFGDTEKNGLKGKIKDYFVKRTYSFPLKRIVNAEIYLNYKEIHAKYIVPPGLDLKTYYPRSNYWNNNRSFIIGCIGRKQEWKGTNDVGRAVEILQKKNMDIQFKVAFNKPNYGEYTLVKPDGDENLSDYYRNVDVLVAPGTVQLGAVHYPVIEAMACGTPVITTGYYPADNHNSYIVPIKSPQIIADTIEYIIHNYNEAREKAERAKQLMRDFDWDKVGEKMLDIIMDNI